MSHRNYFIDTTECFLFDTSNVGELSQTQLSIYPNTANGEFFVDLPYGAEEVQVLPLNGKLIERFVPNGESTMQINLKALIDLKLLLHQQLLNLLQSLDFCLLNRVLFFQLS